MKKILFTYLWIFLCSLTLHGQRATFHHEVLSIEKGMPSNVVYCVLQDKKGYIWAGTAKGVVRYDGEVLETYSTEDGLTDNEIFDMQEGGDGNIYFSTFSGGVSYYDGEQFLSHPQNDKIKKIIQGAWIHSWAIDSVGGILFSVTHYNRINNKDTCMYYTNKDTLYKSEILKEPKYFYKNIHITKDRQVVIVAKNDSLNQKETQLSTLSRITCLDDSTIIGVNIKRAFVWSIINDSYSSVEFDKVSYIFRDKQNALWVATNEGVYYYSEGKLDQQKGEKIFEGVEVSYACSDTEGNLWLATLNKGLIKVPSLHIVDLSVQNIKRLFGINEQMYMQQQYNKVFLVDEMKEQYSYTEFFFQNFYTHLIKKGYNKLGVGSVKNVAWIAQDSILYLAHTGGVVAFKNGQKIRDSKLLNFNVWSTSVAIHQNNVYIGTRKGLYIWDLDLDEIKKREIPMLKTTIEDVMILPKGQVVLGTNGQGLFLQEMEEDTFQHIVQKDGTPSNFVHSLEILKDKLLVGTNRGLGIYYWQTKQWEYLTSKNGLISNDITSIAHYKGKIWVATLSGVTKIDTNYWYSNTKRINIPIVLQEVNISGKKQVLSNYYKVQPLEQNINISFKGITFGNRPIYRYRLLGIHQNWQTVNAGKLQFNQLPPGNYQLEVAAKLASQEWGKPQNLLTLKIIPHYTQTWWFLIVWILLVLVVVLVVGLLILKGITQRTKTQLLIKKLEQKALRSQMNPHFLFNTMNSIQYLITSNQKKAARQYISKLSMLLRRVLQYSEYNLISLEQEIKTLKLYLDIEAMRYGNHVDMHIDIAEDIPSYFKIPPMLLQPMLENALVHGLAPKEDLGYLTLKIQAIDNHILEIIIIDDGIGLKAAQKLKVQKQHTQTEKASMGLINIKKRIENLNKIHKHFICYTVADFKPHDLEPGTKIILKFDQNKLS